MPVPVHSASPIVEFSWLVGRAGDWPGWVEGEAGRGAVFAFVLRGQVGGGGRADGLVERGLEGGAIANSWVFAWRSRR